MKLAANTVSALLLLLAATCAIGKVITSVEESQDRYHICDSPVCLKRAKLIRESLDPCVDPCDDFYSYACGGWIRRHRIPENASSYSLAYYDLWNRLDETFREILDNITLVYDDSQNATHKAAVAYRACLAVPEAGDQYEALRQIMDDYGLGDWPLLPAEKQRHAKHLNWTETLLNVGLRPVFELSVGKDHTYPTSHSIRLFQIRFLNVGRNQLIDPNSRYNAPIITAYKKLIVANAKFMNPNISEMQSKILANDLVEFEGMLANLTVAPQNLRDVLALYRRPTIGYLQKEFPDFPLLDALNKEFSKVNITLNETQPLECSGFDYYGRLTALLKKAEPTTVYNYFGMRTMFMWAPHASKDIRNAFFKVRRFVSEEKNEEPRGKKCVSLLLIYMQEVMGYLYVTHKFNKEAREEAEQIVRVVKEAFNETLQSNAWMDPDTKREAIAKLQKMRTKIGYAEHLLNTTALSEYSKYIPKLNPKTPFLSIWRSVKENNWKLMLEKLRVPYDPDKIWIVGPAVVNAFYNPSANEMVYPAAFLQGVLYEHGLPKSINVASFGGTAGHEMTHGFDVRGSQYDDEGRLRLWWTNATREKFLKKAECFVQQYGSIRDEQAGMQLNGKNTVGENIADNGGLRSAYKAYKKILTEELKEKDTRLRGLEELSGEKLFFIASAMVECNMYRTGNLRSRIYYDPHSPSKYRIDIPMKNLAEFSAVWNCPAHSPMNPDRSTTCDLW